MEPPFITMVSPYGGFGLRAKTSEAARRRIDGLLAACAVEIVQPDLRLSIAEPAARALVEAIGGPLRPMTSGYSMSAATVPDEALLRAHSHMHGQPATEALRAWGPPLGSGAVLNGRGAWIKWEWHARGEAAAAAYDPWCRFLDRHQSLVIDGTSALDVRGEWELRLAGAGGAIAEPPYPPSRVIGHLRGHRATAFLALVFPHVSITDALIADFEHVCAAMGLKLPARALRLSSPTRGANRKLTKLT